MLHIPVPLYKWHINYLLKNLSKNQHWIVSEHFFYITWVMDSVMMIYVSYNPGAVFLL